MASKSEESSAGDGSCPWQSYHTVYTNAKAGMDEVDKEKVQRVVYEMSKGSKYFENEERKEAYMKQKIENMHALCAKLTAADISHYQKIADKRILELEVTRNLLRIWLHIDMDAFYAAVETLSNPSLNGKPLAVGGMSMISTANYEARKFGVRAAMPGFIARKLCPELIFVPTDFKKYTYFSDLTRKVFRKYDANFMAASLDEAYLDVTEVCKERNMTGEEVAEELRGNVYEATGLTCSAGVAPNRLIAKVCSDINKPNGQFVVPNDRNAIMAFISSLPIRKVGGIGKVTEHILHDVLGIKACEDLLQKSSFLCALFSRSSADFFLSVGLGLGGTETPQVRSRKSMSNERTFSATEDESFFHSKLVELAELLSSDMKKEGLCGRTLTLKLKTASFEVRTRALTLQNYIWSCEDILKNATKLLKAELPVSLRLIGLRLSQFNEAKDGALADPSQRTLSNFIKDSHEAFHSESINSNKIPDLSCSNNRESDENHGLVNEESEEKVNELHAVGNTSESEASQLLRPDSLVLPEDLDRISTDRAQSIDSVDGGVLSSSNHEESFVWIDDYKCSLCGVELPPSFVEERQEHLDYHLAERLQEEESGFDKRYLTPKQRYIAKAPISNQIGRQKRKRSPADSKHLPIEMFFVKKT